MFTWTRDFQGGAISVASVFLTSDLGPLGVIGNIFFVDAWLAHSCVVGRRSRRLGVESRRQP
jgi:hypothetical protein